MIWLSSRALAAIGVGRCSPSGCVLTVVSAALFERDAILTTWR